MYIFRYTEYIHESLTYIHVQKADPEEGSRLHHGRHLHLGKRCGEEGRDVKAQHLAQRSVHGAAARGRGAEQDGGRGGLVVLREVFEEVGKGQFCEKFTLNIV